MLSRKLKLTILALASAAALALCIIGCRYYVDHRMPNFRSEMLLYVYPGTPVDEIAESLRSGADVRNVRSLSRVLAEVKAPKPGRYQIKTSHTSIYVARMLANGWQTPGNLVISGTIRSRERLAQKISAQMMVDSLQVADALNDAGFLSRFGFTPETVFALILPDSYQMYWTAGVEEIFERFRKEYDAFWTEDRLDKAKALSLSQLEVSTLASIVSGETLAAGEYPVIAGVYLNRLRKGMKLQADPTVCFCYNYELKRVLKTHLGIDSPYNTYKYAGLPPAPINIPPKACIDAVLNPTRHNYLYFCASPAFDGTHRFAAGYTEHLRNAREFQRALNKR